MRFCVFGCSSVVVLLVLSVVFGARFFPSLSYYNSNLYLARGFALGGLVLGVYIFWVVGLMERQGKESRQRSVWIVISKFLAPVIIAGLFYHLPLTPYPMLRAVVVGKTTSDSYVVDHVNVQRDGRCSGRVMLKNMPPFHDHLCDVAQSVLDQLTPGMEIEFQGWGTKDGLFVKSVRIP